jgi:hypothetical protein
MVDQPKGCHSQQRAYQGQKKTIKKGPNGPF